MKAGLSTSVGAEPENRQAQLPSKKAARPSDALGPGHVSRLQSGGAKQQVGRHRQKWASSPLVPGRMQKSKGAPVAGHIP